MHQRLLYPVVEVMRSLSNLLKSNFVHFLPDTRLIKVDSNDSRIIKSVEKEEPQPEDQVIDKELTQLLQNRDEKRKKTEQQMIEEATEKAAQIIEEAKEQAEKLKAIALEEGKNEGLSEGYQAGVAQANKVIVKAEEQLRMNQLKYDDLVKELEPKFAGVVIDVIQKITGQLLQDKAEIIIHLINTGMREVNISNRKFLIRVSQEDYNYVIENKDKIEGCLNPANVVDFCIDNQLAKGGCIIETESGLVNSSIDIQLQGIISDLKLIAGL